MGLDLGECGQTLSLVFQLLWQPGSCISNRLDQRSRIATSAVQTEGETARPLTETLPTPVTINPGNHLVASLLSRVWSWVLKALRLFSDSTSHSARLCASSNNLASFNNSSLSSLFSFLASSPCRSWSWSKECTISWRARNTLSWLTT